VSAEPVRGRVRGGGAYWAGRVAETFLLLAALAGIGMFAWSIIDIVRIESGPGAGREVSAVLPPLAWPGVFTFIGAMVLLQLVRMLLVGVRRDDGSSRADGSGEAAASTARALAEDDSARPVQTTTDSDSNG